MNETALGAARGFALAMAAHPGVRAVGLSGPAAAGHADTLPDLDPSVLGKGQAPLALRRALVAARALLGTAEIDNRALPYRRLARPGRDRGGSHASGRGLDRGGGRGRHEAPRAAFRLFHRARAHGRGGTAAPRPLGAARRASGAGALPPRRSRGPSWRATCPSCEPRATPSPGRPIPPADRGRDPARRRGVGEPPHGRRLASLVGALFALNRRLRPGEKRLLRHAGALPLAPPDLAAEVEALLAAPAEERPARTERMERAVEALAAQPFTAPSESPETR